MALVACRECSHQVSDSALKCSQYGVQSRKAKRGFLVVVGLLIATSSHAQQMPRFDVEAHCQDVSDIAGGSHQIYNSCIQMEQSSYNTLKDTWSGVSARIRKHCQDVGEIAGGSYQIMESCVQMEEDAAGSRESFSFD